MKLRTIGSNQALLEFKNGLTILFSYESPVAAFVPNEGYEQTDKFISRTTQQHIQRWVGKEACKVVPQSQIAARLNDQVGKHEAGPDATNNDAANDPVDTQ
jgi:hypothetical protein